MTPHPFLGLILVYQCSTQIAWDRYLSFDLEQGLTLKNRQNLFR